MFLALFYNLALVGTANITTPTSLNNGSNSTGVLGPNEYQYFNFELDSVSLNSNLYVTAYALNGSSVQLFTNANATASFGSCNVDMCTGPACLYTVPPCCLSPANYSFVIYNPSAESVLYSIVPVFIAGNEPTLYNFGYPQTFQVFKGQAAFISANFSLQTTSGLYLNLTNFNSSSVDIYIQQDTLAGSSPCYR